MSIVAHGANSAALERDARLVNAREHRIAPGEIVIGVILGRTSEFFDFFVYAIASVLVFPSRARSIRLGCSRSRSSRGRSGRCCSSGSIVVMGAAPN